MKRVLVTGATGKIGRLLIPALAAHKNIYVRTFARNEKHSFGIGQNRVECILGSFENVMQVRAAIKDMDTVVLITSANPNADMQAEMVLQAALEEGVRKIIRLSVFKAAIDGPTSITRLHGATDAQIQSSGIIYTILRPGFFMQNLLFLAAQTIAAQNKLYFGTGEGKFGLIDLRDIADCIEQVVVSDGFNNEALTLTGPESISFRDIAHSLTNILGQDIQYVPVTSEAVEQSIRGKGLGDWYATVMRQLCDQYKQNWGDVTTSNIERITGHKARSFERFAREIFVPALQLLSFKNQSRKKLGTEK